VATFCAAKLIEKGAIVLALSDSKGYMYAKDGFNQEQLDEARSCLHLASHLLMPGPIYRLHCVLFAGYGYQEQPQRQPG
jgi:glutamate dehydrogenase/leucine dehydrogenase